MPAPTHSPRVRTFYRPQMCPPEDAPGNFSKSPTKPRRLMEHLRRTKQIRHFDIVSAWEPFEREDFLVAHEKAYVDAFFDGKEGYLRGSNGLAWSEQFADSVRYTNASLWAAVRSCVDEPAIVAFSPTSGFHHATPGSGGGFCTFSGQVIASVNLWRQRQMRGAWLDLDGHHGNSIEDSRGFVADLDEAVPHGWNINPRGSHRAYLDDLAEKLDGLAEPLQKGELHYLVFCHGADSHVDDDLGGQVNTEEWLEASRIVYGFVRDMSERLGRPVPLALSLFGGYRKRDYEGVLKLHAADLRECRRILGAAED